MFKVILGTVVLTVIIQGLIFYYIYPNPVNEDYVQCIASQMVPGNPADRLVNNAELMKKIELVNNGEKVLLTPEERKIVEDAERFSKESLSKCK
jgi:hypothetical protein